VQTTRESESIVLTVLSRARTPRPAKTVRAPKRSGIAAATTERKTSRRIKISSGAASSSARSVELSDSSCSALATVAKPDWVATTGGRIRVSSVRCSAGTVSRIARVSGTWKSIRTRALRGLGRRPPTEPRSQGEITVAARSLRSALTSPIPWRSTAAAGPCSSTAKGEDSPKWLLASSSPSATEVPGTVSESGASLPSTPSPSTPSTVQASRTTTKPARGRRYITYPDSLPLGPKSTSAEGLWRYVTVPKKVPEKD
jgi:hypothetical protein